MIFSAGLPTGMEGLTYPIPFSDPETVLKIARHAEAVAEVPVEGDSAFLDIDTPQALEAARRG